MFWRPVEVVDKTKPEAPGNLRYDCSLAWNTTLGVMQLHRLDGVQAASEAVRNRFAHFTRATGALVGALANHNPPARKLIEDAEQGTLALEGPDGPQDR